MKDNKVLWQRHIRKQAKSSLTIQAYCDQHALSYGMFYYWKRKLQDVPDPAAFTELQIVNTERYRGAIHIRFPSGVELWLDHDIEPSFLKEVIGC